MEGKFSTFKAALQGKEVFTSEEPGESIPGEGVVPAKLEKPNRRAGGAKTVEGEREGMMREGLAGWLGHRKEKNN